MTNQANRGAFEPTQPDGDSDEENKDVDPEEVDDAARDTEEPLELPSADEIDIIDEGDVEIDV